MRSHGGTWFLREVFDILKDAEQAPFPSLDWDIQFGGNDDESNKTQNMLDKQMEKQRKKQIEKVSK